MTDDREFEAELSHLLNYYSRDALCGVPDVILSGYLNDQIKALAKAKKQVGMWYTPLTVEDRPLFH